MNKIFDSHVLKLIDTFSEKTDNKFFFKIREKKLTESDFQKFCHIKRFYERWMADNDFRNNFSSNPDKYISLYDFKIDAEEVKPLWDSDFIYEQNHQNNYFNRFEDIFFQQVGKKSSLKYVFTDTRFQSWHNQQINRCNSQFHPQYHNTIGHYPACFELSRGCSVGCWFCGISAPKLDDIFLYNEENAGFWRQLLESLKSKLGENVGSSFCYWATDPLDNPDYEKFCIDFHEVLGNFPYTSTAQTWKYPERVKALLKLSVSKGRTNNRFSILSLKILNQIHQEFSAEELATVELAFQNPEALSSKAIVGRANKRKQSDLNQASEQSSIACVTGFLFNMVERSVKLISPCPASKKWPDGYIIFDQGNFSDVKSLENLLEKIISSNMSDCITDDRYLKLREDIQYESLPNGFQLSTSFMTQKFSNYPKLREFGEALYAGNLKVWEIIPLMKNIGIPEANTLYFLNLLLTKGVFEEEVQPK
ncbi:radical SAM family RiPP maturation amino acid epimerase [Nostoc sp.]